MADKKDEDTCEGLWNFELTILQFVGSTSLRKAFGSKEYHRPSILEIFLVIVAAVIMIISVLSSMRMLTIIRFDDLSLTSEIISVLLSGFLITVRILRLSTQNSALFSILRDFHLLWEDVKTMKHIRSEVNGLINRYKVPRYFYSFFTFFVGVVYGSVPYGSMAAQYLRKGRLVVDELSKVYPINYPVPHSSLLSFNLVVFYEELECYFGILYWVACDIIFVHLTLHLRINALALSKEFNIDSQDDLVEVQERFNVNRIVNLAKRHERLYRLFQQVETMFNPIFFFTILFNGINLCCSILMLDKQASEGDWVHFSRSVIHATTLFVQIVIYCDFAHQASEQLNAVASSIFKSPWTVCDKKVQKLLMIIMMRANKEYKFMAYGLLNLDREQMTRIFKTSGSYFTLLRSFE